MWHDFEVRHGNEDTFREMLRIKRSVQAQFNTQVSVKIDIGARFLINQKIKGPTVLVFPQVNFMSAQMLAAAASKAAGASKEDLNNFIPFVY